MEIHKINFDAGYQIGYKRRNKEVAAWARKRKRTIRRDELLSYLSGHSPPRYQRVDAMDDRSNEDIEVQCAGSLGINGSLHNPLLSAGVTVPTVAFPSAWSRRRNSRSENFVGDPESNRETYKEARKRSMSSQDVVMDSVGHKKCRFL